MFKLKTSFYDYEEACHRTVTIAKVAGWDEADKVLAKKQLTGHFFLAPITAKKR